MFRDMFLRGVIYQMQTGTTICVLNQDFFLFVLIWLQRINLSSVRAELDKVQVLQLKQTKR